MSPCPTQPCLLHKGTSYSINVTFASSKEHILSGSGQGQVIPSVTHCWEGRRVAGEGSGWEEECSLVVFLRPLAYVKGTCCIHVFFVFCRDREPGQ